MQQLVYTLHKITIITPDALSFDVDIQASDSNQTIADKVAKECIEKGIDYSDEELLKFVAEAKSNFYAGKDILDNKNRNSVEVPIKFLTSVYKDRKVKVVGRVYGISELETVILAYLYKCRSCGQQFTTTDTDESTTECIYCGRLAKLDRVNSPVSDRQIVELQELGNDYGMQVSVSCVNYSPELFWSVGLGKKAEVEGILSHILVQDKFTRQKKYLKYLKVESIKELESSRVELTADDIMRFMQLAEDPDHYERLLKSFAPHLYGMREQKEVAIFTLASIGTDRPFNTLIAGPPAQGKTQLVKYTVSLMPGGMFATMARASTAGLTTTSEMDQNTKTRVVRPGMFVLCDGSIAGLTELQAIKDGEVKSLNDVMERKEVSSAQAGNTQTFSARCAVIIDSNNFEGSWMYGMRLAHNLSYLKTNVYAFISRLDLISIVEEVKDYEIHKKIAKTNFNTYKASTNEIDIHGKDWQEDGELRYGLDTLRKYFAYITSLPLPVIPDELEDEFVNNYIESHKNDQAYMVDGRYNRTVTMLSRFIARLLLHEQVTRDDLQAAIRVVNKSKDIQTKTDEGEHDGNVTIGLPEKAVIQKKLSQEAFFWKAYEDKVGEKGYVTLQEIVEATGWAEWFAENYIGRHLKAGKLMESEGQGKYTKAGSL